MGETILVVDDVLAITSLFSELIKRNDPFCRVITAQNGREACKTAATFLPDLIIMDWEMPGMSGIEALIKLKHNNPTKDIPIIITSGATEPSHLKKALDAGAIDYIKKPIDELELIARINSALTLSQTIKDLHAQKHKLQNEQSRNEAILSSLLPENILNELKTTGYSLPRKYLNVVVIFIDLVDFSVKTTTLSPHKLIKELNELFSSFDQIITNNNCTRIKTIGDAYLAVSSLSEQPGNMVFNAAKAAREIQQYLLKRNKQNTTNWEVRIGMYQGDIIASLVSLTNLSFDIFGDTVNLAARFQENCDPMQINIPEKIKNTLNQHYKIIERSPRNVKGRGIFPMYYLHHPISEETNENEERIMSLTNPLHVN